MAEGRDEMGPAWYALYALGGMGIIMDLDLLSAHPFTVHEVSAYPDTFKVTRITRINTRAVRYSFFI